MTVLAYMHDGFARRFVQFLMLPRPQYWLVRLYLSGSVLLTTCFAWVLPINAQRITLDAIGTEAWVVLYLISATALVGLVDCIVNDLMPPRFHLRWADRRRHQIFMVLAILLFLMVWLQALHSTNTLLVMRYILDCTACVLVAVFDTVARVKQVRRVMGNA